MLRLYKVLGFIYVLHLPEICCNDTNTLVGAWQCPLKDTERFYKVFLGEYRIIYQIEEQSLLLIVIKIAHLKDY
ncbi:type II toxin-antitoxin system RelE/ParE family toxin [Nostoc sp. CHAB 5834]|nr:type II toxin-antitoxin system RelE/ParE family toxin [Nostoc sp. CHAB 5834]